MDVFFEKPFIALLADCAARLVPHAVEDVVVPDEEGPVCSPDSSLLEYASLREIS